ncbi:MAG: AraC family transcriptional regulator [Spirochaetes bacterium]|nr:AraC family transcriptional regulator [Spirochaetota bacterium]
MKYSGRYVASSLLVQLLKFAESRDLNIKRITEKYGIDPERFPGTESKVPMEIYNSIFSQIAADTGDPLFGLHMGDFAEPEHWSVLGYVFMNCRTLSDALKSYERYMNIVGAYLKPELTETNSGIKISFIKYNPDYTGPLSCTDAALSALAKMVRKAAGNDTVPSKAFVVHDKARGSNEYENILRCPVVFSSGENSLFFSKETISRNLSLPDTVLVEHLKNFAEECLSAINYHGKFSEKVLKEISNNLGNEDISIKTISKKLHISQRALQKNLENEKTSFSFLLREIREKTAKEHLKRNMPVDDISYLLGFSEPSVFRRAFKKWTGSTPGNYSKEIKIGAKSFSRN